MSATEQQKRKLVFDLKLLKRKDRSKWSESIKFLHEMSMGGKGDESNLSVESIRNIKYNNWTDEDFKDVLNKFHFFSKKNHISTSFSTNKSLIQEPLQTIVEESEEFIIIEDVKCLIVGRCDEKIKLKYENHIDHRVGNLLKTDAVKERKQNCIDPYGLVSKSNSKDLIESSIKIAVVTSAWKTHDYIEQFLDSIENNTMHPCVVLIGVDACEDTKNSLNKILNRKKYSFQIKTFYSNENVGTYNIRNNLNDLAFDCYDCDAIVCMDSDDMFHSEYIRCAHDALVKNPDSIIAPNIILNFDHKTGSKKFILKYCTGVNCFKKEIWKKIGYYLPIKASADNEWIHRCMKLKQKILVSNSLLYYRRMHEKQLTNLFPVVKNNHERIKADNISKSNLILKPFLINLNFNKNFINDYFDQVYCLNLKRRPDRMESMQSKLQHLKINFKRFEAIDGNDLQIDAINHKFNQSMSIYEIACALSHQKIFEDAKKNNYEKILIFEDDVLISKDFVEKSKIIKNFDWNLFYFGATQYRKWSNCDHEIYHPNDGTCGAFAYAINKECYLWILDFIQSNGIDRSDHYLIHYNQFFNKKCFVKFPNLCKPLLHDSNIRQPRDQKIYDEKFKWNLIKNELI
jgi:GR25 family glycosyltransferase involved in LPS biosynthesis